MTLEEIKAAVEAGKTVHWSHEGYTVVKDGLGQWMIVHEQGHAIGLTWRDGVTMNGNPEDFFIALVAVKVGHQFKCDMTEDCNAPVTHLDQDGYVYCTAHGIDRRSWQPCRKLRPWELRRLQRGEPLRRY